MVQTMDVIDSQQIIESQENKAENEYISDIVVWDKYDWDIEIESKNIHYPKFHDSNINEMLKKYFNDHYSEKYFNEHFSVNINDGEFCSVRFEVTYEDVNIISIFFTAIIIDDNGFFSNDFELWIPIIIDKKKYEIYTSIDDVLKINDESINIINTIFKESYPNYWGSSDFYTMTEYYEYFFDNSKPLLTKDFLILINYVTTGHFIKLPIEKIRRYIKIL
jgi:hypothetical protein